MRTLILHALASLALAGGCSSPDEGSTSAPLDPDPDADRPLCTPGRQETCACASSERTGVRICVNDGSRFGACYGCDEPPLEDKDGGDASVPLPDASEIRDPLACIQTDLGELAIVSRGVAAPARHVYRWRPPNDGLYRLSGTDGKDQPHFDVRFGDCDAPIDRSASGVGPHLIELEQGTPIVVEVSWQAAAQGTVELAEHIPEDCTDGEIDCGEGCAKLENTDASCGCRRAPCQSEDGKRTACVPSSRAPYGTCELLTPVTCDEGLLLCGDDCVASPPKGYGMCSGACVELDAVEHCGSGCVDCRVERGADALCVAAGDDFACRLRCEPAQIDCGSGCEPVYTPANYGCGCERLVCPTWVGRNECVVVDGQGICRFREP